MPVRAPAHAVTFLCVVPTTHKKENKHEQVQENIACHMALSIPKCVGAEVSVPGALSQQDVKLIRRTEIADDHDGQDDEDAAQDVAPWHCQGAEATALSTGYLNNIVEQDHRAIKRIIRPMMGFKDFRCARVILSGIELMHMVRKGQMIDAAIERTVAEQFYSLLM